MKKIISIIFIFAFSTLQSQTILGTPIQGVSVIARESYISDTPSTSTPTIVSLPELTPTSNSTEVGTLNGQLTVSQNGGANYSIPFQVPPGVNGVVPQLGLIYNSQDANGTAGFGWNVSGISMISRIPQTKYHDGSIRAVNLTSSDRFALDGQRLLLKEDSVIQNYGSSGAIYETENFSNLKITQIGENYITTILFKVEYPDGSIATYKNIAGNSNYSFSRNDYAIVSWENTQGIKIIYEYTTLQNNVFYLSSVKYGSVLNNTPINQINFIYTTRERKEQSYIAGNLFSKESILKKIEVLANGMNFRSYTLLYETTTLGYQRLISVTESSGSKSYNPTVFKYFETNDNILSTTVSGFSVLDVEQRNVKQVSGNFDIDGKMDFILYPTFGNNAYKKYWEFDKITDSSNTVFLHEQDFGATKFADIFATTILGQEGNTGPFKLLPFQGWTVVTENETNTTFSTYVKNETVLTGITLQNQKIIPSTTVNLPNGICGGDCRDTGRINKLINKRFFSGDFNGDGITDVIAFGKAFDYTFCNLNNSYCQQTIQRYSSSGAYFIDLSKINTDNYYLPLGPVMFSDITDDSNIQVADVDGDGKSDILHFVEGKVIIYSLNNSNELSYYIYANVDIKASHPVLLGDYNGDGKIDFIIPKDYGTNYSLFTGTGRLYYDYGFVKADKIYPLQYFENKDIPATISQHSDYLYQNIIPVDINNDGKTDLISQISKNYAGSATNYDIQIFDNKNDSFIGSASKSISLNGSYKYPIPIFLNSNNQNQNIEFGLIRNSSIFHFKSEKDFSKEKLIKTVTTGNGVIETITYKPLINEDVPNTFGIVAAYKPSTYLEAYPNVDIEIAPSFNVVVKVEIQAGSIYKKQIYGYYGAVTNMEGLGFLGFRAILKTNWFEPYSGLFTNNNAIFSEVNYFSPSLRGRLTSTFTESNIRSNSFWNGLPTNFISKKTLSYDSPYTNNISFNKVFRLRNNLSIVYNGLTNVIAESTSSFDDYDNILQNTTVVKEGLSIIQTTSEINEYDNLPMQIPYIVGRFNNNKIVKSSYEDTFSSEEKYSYTSNNLLKTIMKKGTNTDFITETNEYDLYGNLIKKSISAPDLMQPRVTNFEYSSTYGYRFLTKSTDVEGLNTNFTYDNSKGLIITETNSNNLVTTYNYDVWGKRISVKDYLNNIVSINYEKTSNNTFTNTKLSPEGSESKEIFDVLGRKIIVGAKNIQGVYSYTKTDYDNLDKEIRKYEPYVTNDVYNFIPPQYTQTEFNLNGKVSKITSYTGKSISYDYNGLSKTSITIVDGITTIKTDITDAIGNIKSINESPMGGTIYYSYFANGGMKATSYLGNNIFTEQDGWGRRTKLTDPSAGVYTYSYNNLGEVLTEGTPKGITTYKFNDFGKIIEKKVLGKTSTNPPTTTSTKTTNTYDNTTKLLTGVVFEDIENSITTNYNYEYNSYKQLFRVSESGPMAFFQTATLYDNYGRPLNLLQTAATIVTGTGIINKRSDKWTTNVYKNGFLYKITDGLTQDGSGNVLWQINEVNEKGQLTKALYGNGICIENTYSTYSYPESINHKNGTLDFMTLNYDFNQQRGVLNSRSNNVNGTPYNENFTYDDLNRLINYTNATGVNESQTYDDSGRIKTNKNGVYNYTNLNKPYVNTSINVNPESKAYFINNALQQINYNAFKSPSSIYQESNLGNVKERIDFLYNKDQNRSTMFYGDTNIDKFLRKYRRHYSADGTMEITEEQDTTGNTIATKFITYIDGDGYTASVLYKSDGGLNFENLYLHRDNQSSIIAISNQNKQMLERRVFDAWGNLIKLQNSNGQYIIDNGQTLIANYTMLLDRGYTGHEHLLGVLLINMNGRLYDPKLHRFLMPDNFVQDPENTQSYNRYAYCMNNPLQYTDFSGESWWSDNWVQLVVFVVSVGVGIAVTVLTGGMASPIAAAMIAGAASGFTGGALGVALNGGSFKDAMQAGFGQAAVSGVLGGFGGIAAQYAPIGVGALEKAAYAMSAAFTINGLGNIMQNRPATDNWFFNCVMAGSISGTQGYLEAKKLGYNGWFGDTSVKPPTSVVSTNVSQASKNAVSQATQPQGLPTSEFNQVVNVKNNPGFGIRSPLLEELPSDVLAKGSFFENSKYSSKVLEQMSNTEDILHSFPKSVDGFSTRFGQFSIKIGADGNSYQWLKMHGSFGGKTGIFEYTKDANGIINHRFLNTPKK